MGVINRTIRINQYTVSIQRSVFHYCTDDTYEIAVLQKNKIVVPDHMTHWYDDDTVIGWMSDERLNRFLTELRGN